MPNRVGTVEFGQHRDVELARRGERDRARRGGPGVGAPARRFSRRLKVSPLQAPLEPMAPNASEVLTMSSAHPTNAGRRVAASPHGLRSPQDTCNLVGSPAAPLHPEVQAARRPSCARSHPVQRRRPAPGPVRVDAIGRSPEVKQQSWTQPRSSAAEVCAVSKVTFAVCATGSASTLMTPPRRLRTCSRRLTGKRGTPRQCGPRGMRPCHPRPGRSCVPDPSCRVPLRIGLEAVEAGM